MQFRKTAGGPVSSQKTLFLPKIKEGNFGLKRRIVSKTQRSYFMVFPLCNGNQLSVPLHMTGVGGN